MYFVNSASNSFTLKSVSKEDSYHIICCIKANRSAGIDKNLVRLLQEAGTTTTILECVNYIIALNQYGCGVRGTALQWFQSYLYERKQICSISNTVSSETEIHCGVPHGSNLVVRSLGVKYWQDRGKADKVSILFPCDSS